MPIAKRKLRRSPQLVDIRFAGFGGQGIILMGIALARATVLYDIVKEGDTVKRKFAAQTQSYGPSARGGQSRCDVRISESEIYYPFIDVPDILVVMSEQAYRKYAGRIEKASMMILDSDLVRQNPSCTVVRIPATRIAKEQLEARIVANMVMLGAVQAITNIVSWDALLKSTLEMVPESTHELNRKALDKGRELGKEAAATCAYGG